MKTIFKGVMFISSCIILLIISCSKDENQSTVPVGFFTNGQIASGGTKNDSTKTDSTGLETGVKFRSTIATTITGVKFYKSLGNGGVHLGQLYSASGQLLASNTFTNETDSGWQTVLFATPVPIAANTTYIAAYYCNLGNYISSDYMLVRSISNGNLTILADGTDGPNGVFAYTNSPVFPDSPYLATNYWLDVLQKDK